MATVVNSRTWRVCTAAATGAHHLATNMPYEDAVAVSPSTGSQREEASVAVAVADGHGHARHFRSSRGSQIAVDIACEMGAQAGQTVATLADAAEIERWLRTHLGPDLVARWRRAVEKDLDDDPVSAAELAAAGLTSTATIDDLVYGYGATLLVAVTAGSWLFCLQIGDGDLFTINGAGVVTKPVPIDPRLDGSRTTSLCQADAVNSLRYAVMPVTATVGAVLLATDGYGNAQVRNDWEDAFGADLAALTAEHGVGWIGEQLPHWVRRCASAEGSGDDVTVALMFASDTAWKRRRGGVNADLTVANTVQDVLDPAASAGRHRTGSPEGPVPDPPTTRLDVAAETTRLDTGRTPPPDADPTTRLGAVPPAPYPSPPVAHAPSPDAETRPAAAAPGRSARAATVAPPRPAALPTQRTESGPPPVPPAPIGAQRGSRRRGAIISLTVIIGLAIVALVVLVLLLVGSRSKSASPSGPRDERRVTPSTSAPPGAGVGQGTHTGPATNPAVPSNPTSSGSPVVGSS